MKLNRDNASVGMGFLKSNLFNCAESQNSIVIVLTKVIAAACYSSINTQAHTCSLALPLSLSLSHALLQFELIFVNKSV